MTNLTNSMNSSISSLVFDGIKASWKNPVMLLNLLTTAAHQSKAASRRCAWEDCGTHVPPIMIMSVTGRCNLACAGCYAKTLHGVGDGPELDADRIAAIIREARSLGTSIVILAGGEPLMRPEIFDITAEFPDVLFPLFTNGLLIDKTVVSRVKKRRNIIPMISLEGGCAETDARRGSGVFARLEERLHALKKAGVFFGSSITVSQSNFSAATSENFIAGLMDRGVRAVMFVEYVPVAPGTEAQAITMDERCALVNAAASFRKRFPAAFIAFPGEEEQFGGCLAAGRGFVHVNASGDLEPCPFAPYSDVNLRSMSLKAGLQSDLLSAIRSDHSSLRDVSGGCALWANRERLMALQEAA